MTDQNYEGGFLREQPDDELRVTHRWDAQGNPMPDMPYTPEQIAALEQDLINRATLQAQEARKAAVKLIITDLKIEKDRMDPILAKSSAQITGGDTKDVARAAKRIADAAIDIARLLTE